MNTYKIDQTKTSQHANRINKRLVKILSASFIGFILLSLVSEEEKFGSQHLSSILFAFILLFLVYHYNKKMTLIMAESLQIIIDRNSVIRTLEVNTKDPRLNLFDRISWVNALSIAGSFTYKLEFYNIKSMEMKNGDLWVKGKNSSTFTGRNIVLIPEELADFELVKKEIHDKWLTEQQQQISKSGA